MEDVGRIHACARWCRDRHRGMTTVITRRQTTPGVNRLSAVNTGTTIAPLPGRDAEGFQP